MKTLQSVFTSFVVFCFLVTSFPTRVLASGKDIELNSKTVEMLGALKEGRENETIAEYYSRMGRFLPKEFKLDFAEHLKNRGDLRAPMISVDKNEITYSLSGYKMVVSIVPKGQDNEVRMNGELISKKDFKTMKSYMSRLDQIFKKSFSTQQKSAQLNPLWSLVISSAKAEIDWMPVLLGAAVGGAAGYFAGGSMMWAAAGAVVAGGLAYYFWGQKKCPKTEQCCSNGAVFKKGCCADLNMTEYTDADRCTSSSTSTLNTPASSQSLVPSSGVK